MKLELGSRIRAYRKQMGLTQEQLAEALGVTVGAVSKWESGQNTPELAMLVDLAELFEVSVDVLLGYTVHSQNHRQAAGQLRAMQLEKCGPEGCRAAEKMLAKYPNYFDVVYHSGELFFSVGIEQGEQRLLRRALELFRHSLELIGQNEDETVSEFSIHNHISMLYSALGDHDLALEELKKRNFDGVNNIPICYLMSSSGHHDEAWPYLHAGALDCLANLVRLSFTLANIEVRSGKQLDALGALQWTLQAIAGLRLPGQPSYLDKVEVILLSACVDLCATAGDFDAARGYLQRAFKTAKLFDAAPSYNLGNIRFYGDQQSPANRHVAYDDFGKSAMAGLEAHLRDGCDPQKPYCHAPGVARRLMELWEEICHENEAAE